MNKRLFMSVATAALIAGTSFVNAQSPGGAGAGSAGGGAGMSREAPAGGGAAGGGASMRGGTERGGAEDRAAPGANSAPSKRDEATDTTNKSEQKQPAAKQSQSDDKMQRDNGNQRATDQTRDSGKNAKDMKAEDKSNPAANSKSTADSKSTTTEKSTTTTGQAAAGAKLTTEQRTKVTTVIKQQNIAPVTNVNFSVSVGTRVPRDVHFHPVPAEIVTIYPAWRGYNLILVSNQIVIIDPATYEIVAVIDA